MDSLIEFVVKHTVFSVIIAFVNLFLALGAVKKASIVLNKRIVESAGGSIRRVSVYSRGSDAVRKYLYDAKKGGIFGTALAHARKRMDRSGFRNRSAALWYLGFQYLMPLVVFTVSLILNFPDVFRSAAASLLVILSVEAAVRRGQAKLRRQFDRNAYKIYKFLHNQVSSGIKASDAFKTAYEVVEKGELRKAMVRAAASFELSRDIDSALKEFAGRFDSHDTHTLCTAVRLGVETGDNAEMLGRQEGIMFKKYFNHIQAETEACRTKSVICAVIFTAVIILLVSIPLLKDATDSMSRIFPS